MPEGIAVNRRIHPVDFGSRVRSHIYRTNKSVCHRDDDSHWPGDRDCLAFRPSIVAGWSRRRNKMTGNEFFAFVLFGASAIGFAAALGLYLIWRSDHK
jgi:hypothetical protein